MWGHAEGGEYLIRLHVGAIVAFIHHKFSFFEREDGVGSLRARLGQRGSYSRLWFELLSVPGVVRPTDLRDEETVVRDHDDCALKVMYGLLQHLSKQGWVHEAWKVNGNACYEECVGTPHSAINLPPQWVGYQLSI